MNRARSTSSGIPVIAGGKPVRNDFLVFGVPQIEEDEIQEVVATLRSGWIGTGPKVNRFERQFAKYKNSQYAIAVNSCSAALHLSFLALGIGSGDEVITTPMSFGATANAIIHTGARPVFADCDRKTMNIDPAEIVKKITPRTKAILPLHFAGRPCPMDSIMTIAKKHNLRVIEDCAHAIETKFKGTSAGRFGEVGCFSFYVTKNIITGEGGMVITCDHSIAEKLKIFALHGMSQDAWKRFSDDGYKHYTFVGAGYKYNMTDMQASLGIHQLPRVDRYLEKRRLLWERYDAGLRNLPLLTPPPSEPDTVHARHLYTILLDLDQLSVNRDFVLNALTKENIGVGVHYIALHMHPFYKQFLSSEDRFPNAAYVSERTISLPLSARLTEEDIEDVIVALNKILSHYRR